MSGLVLSAQSAAPRPALPPHNLGPHPPRLFSVLAKSVVLLASPWLLDLLSPEGLAASGSLTPFFCSNPSPSPSALAAVYLELSLADLSFAAHLLPAKGFLVSEPIPAMWEDTHLFPEVRPDFELSLQNLLGKERFILIPHCVLIDFAGKRFPLEGVWTCAA